MNLYESQSEELGQDGVLVHGVDRDPPPRTTLTATIETTDEGRGVGLLGMPAP